MRSLARFAPVVFALTLAACGGSSSPAAAPSSAPASPSAAAPSTAAAGSTAAKPAASTGASAKPAAASGAPAASAKPAASAAASPSGGAAATAGGVQIRIGQIPSTAAAPFLVPVDDGSFAARGINASITPVTDTAQTMISIASGQLEMGTVTMGAAALNAFARGTDLTIIASGGIDGPGHAAFAPVMVRTDLMDSGKVKSLADLKGLKVALNARGVILEYSLYKALSIGKLTMNDVDIVTMPWPDMVAAMANKNLDAGLIGQPLAGQAASKGIAKILSDDYAPLNQNATLVANSNWYKSHKDASTTFLEVYLQAIRKLADGKIKQDEKALAIIEKWTKVTPDVIRSIPDPAWPKDGKLNVKSIEDQQAFFLTTKELNYSQPQDINKLIDYSALDQALKNLGG